MLEIFSIILVLILLSSFIEDKTKIPFVLIVIILSYVANMLFDLDVLGENFEEIMYLMLPIILIPDVLGLSRSELKDNAFDIFYLAFIAVIISIILAVGLTLVIDTKYHFSMFELLILFTPLMATDVVSVGAIFSKFKLPQKLKLYAEGESLFNDITAMLIFFFIALPVLGGEDLSFSSLLSMTIYTVISSTIIGFAVGLLGYYAFKISSNTFEEFISIYVMASLSFLIADKFHLSGILAVVISVLFFKLLFDKEGHYKKISYHRLLKHLNNKSSSENSFRAYKKEAHFLGLFANAVIFISIANVIHIDLLFKYKWEIVYTFILTTLIRYFIVYLLVYYKKLSFTWHNILTLAGMKGGLALIMIVSLNDSFMHKEMFVSIILGVVILSIFVYTLGLMYYLYLKQNTLIVDIAHDYKLVFKDIKELLEKDKITGAYNQIVFEDLIEKEIEIAQRYKSDFSLVSMKVEEKVAIKINKMCIKSSDYFGKMNDVYVILLRDKGIDDTLAFVDTLKGLFDMKTHLGVVQYAIGDDILLLKDKLHTAIESKNLLDVEI